MGILTFIGIFIAILLVLISIGYYGIRESTYEDMLRSNNQSTDSKDNNKKKTKTKKKDETGKTTNQNKTNSNNVVQSRKKQSERNSDNQSVDQPEEEPIVIIPDPFTNQLNSNRYAGVSNQSNTFVSSFSRKDKDTETSKKHTNVNINSSTVNSQNNVLNQNVQMNQNSNIQPVVEHFQAINTTLPVSNQVFNNYNQQKIKPKATVKPNQATVKQELPIQKSVNLQQQPALGLTKTSPNTSIIKLQQVNQIQKPSTIDELQYNVKIKELNDSLNDKSKQIDQLNKSNSTLKTDLIKLQSDLDTLKQTNNVIQKELTKMTQQYTSLAKEKLVIEERGKQSLDELKSLKSNEKPSDDNLNTKLQELTNELKSKESLIKVNTFFN